MSTKFGEPRQINIRLPEEDHVFLEAEAFLTATTVSKIVKGLVETKIDELIQATETTKNTD